MVSKLINSGYFETYFVLKYCMFCQICSKSVYPLISAILQCTLCISFLWKRHGFRPIECLQSLF